MKQVNYVHVSCSDVIVAVPYKYVWPLRMAGSVYRFQDEYASIYKAAELLQIPGSFVVR